MRTCKAQAETAETNTAALHVDAAATTPSPQVNVVKRSDTVTTTAPTRATTTTRTRPSTTTVTTIATSSTTFLDPRRDAEAICALGAMPVATTQRRNAACAVDEFTKFFFEDQRKLEFGEPARISQKCASLLAELEHTSPASAKTPIPLLEP